MPDPAQQPLPPDQPALTPVKLIQTYSAEDWEAFVEEWAEGFNPAYDQVARIGGAGDMGRDVIGHIEPATVRPRPCDIYQCKHYDHPLQPSDVWSELGKLCVHTHLGHFPTPRRYRFVPPRNVGPKLYNLLNATEKLRAELVANWDTHCRRKISEVEEYPLDGALRTHVDQFDFSLVWYLTPAEIVNQHSRTRYWHRRFKIDPPTRPESPPPPQDVQAHEFPYVHRLLDAYANHLGKPVTVADLPTLPAKIMSNFTQARGTFFIADALARFSRDHFPGGFDGIKQHVHDGVVDVTLAGHTDGFECLLATLRQAAGLPLPASGLSPYVGPADKKGMCHHLANDGKLAWVQS
ncbi:hypothetical protein J0H58_12095 [bacterium]|nr:hypothetical protein [bacterium]